ncbi:MAG: cytochrome C [Holophagaceae bacterium]|nr:cytochrome C [Holophagaceae bacterium]
MIRKTLLLCVAILGFGILTACALLSPQTSFAPTHPEGVEASVRPLCSDCHGTEAMKGGLKNYNSFDHTPTFVKNHRFQANQDSATCASCHAPSFCADCHGGKVSMSASVKLGDRPDRVLAHRGNYLILHRMDGKMDPGSCYKCHGRSNNDKCATCHK